MNNITVIHVSDIHYEKNEPENQGLVLNAFFIDLANKISKENKENTYCIISGDLVNKGSSDRIFDDFYDYFIANLVKYLPLSHIYCSPGNHDLNRRTVEENFEKIVNITNTRFTETEFNDFVKSSDGNMVLAKFSFFENFCKKRMLLPNFNVVGYSEAPIPEVSFYFVNCSLLSFGGYREVDDRGKLKIETSGINKWLQENEGRTKVLVMHHPLDYLTNFAKSEIKSMLNRDIDILISGHIHEQDLQHNYVSEQHGVVNLGSPQLFSNKTDLNGYSILTFTGHRLTSVEYRQWIKRQRKFMAGQDFAGTEDGVRRFTLAETAREDQMLQKLQTHFTKAMRSYSSRFMSLYFFSKPYHLK